MGAYPLIDIESVLAEKLPNKKIPKAAIWLLKKIIHQDWMNVMLKDYYGGAGIEFAEATLNYLKAHIESYGFERIDPNKKYIFVSNHPLGGLDGMILISTFGQRFQEVKFVVNDLLMFIEPLRCLFVPINKYGRMKQDYAEQIRQAFDSDAQMLYFPAGLCSRLINKKIQDLEWKKTFIIKAKESKRDIVPLYFDGQNSRFFYRIERLRSRLGIRFNIGTLLLPHEMMRQKHQTFDLYIGEPYPYEQITDEKNIQQWVQFFREQTYQLKPNHQ